MADPAGDLNRAWERIEAHEAERARHRATRKRQGAFYTPRYMADALATATLGRRLDEAVVLKDRRSIERLTVFDPAVGAGALLLAALDLMALAHRAASERAGEPVGANLDADLAARRRRLLPCLYGVDIEPGALKATRAALNAAAARGREQPNLHTLDVLLEALPDQWPRRFGAVVGNPPFGSVNRLGRRDARQIALARTYPHIWQDKIDISAFFVVRGGELTEHAAFIVPAALLAADKARRFRALLAERYLVRFLELRDAFPFPQASVTVGLLDLQSEPLPEPPSSQLALFQTQVPVVGWRFGGTSATAPEVLEAFARRSAPPPGVLASEGVVGARWHVVDDVSSARWSHMDQVGTPLGTRFLVGKGMETGCNGAFLLSAAEVEHLSAAERAAFVRPRIRGLDIDVLALRPADAHLIFPENATAFEELPLLLQGRLRKERPHLVGRAAYRRGDCEWWRYTWPLHARHYHKFRVVTPYRSRTHRFAVAGPADGIGLTDTAAIFVEDEQEAWALALLLCTEPIEDRYTGIAKHTGAGMMEFFENQLREIPLPPGWSELVPRLAKRARSAFFDTESAVAEASEWVAAAFAL